MLCEYGCGEEAKYYIKYIKRWCCSKKGNSCPAIRKKLSQVRKISCNKPEAKMKNSQAQKKSWSNITIKKKRLEKINNENARRIRSEKAREQCSTNYSVYMNSFPRSPDKIKKQKEKLKRLMISGHAAHMNCFIKKLPEFQIETFKNVQLVAPYPILNYLVCIRKEKWYSIDIVIPQLGIAIECDGSYHKYTEKEDRERQKDLEEQGWKFLRYTKVPTIEQLREDIKKLI